MEIANWYGHRFVVEPGVIKGFTDLSVTASVETDDSNKAVATIKNAAPATVSMTAVFHAAMGVSVRAEAEAFLRDVGKSDYLTIGGSKILDCLMMLKQATVENIEIGGGGVWSSCEVQLSFVQGSGNGSGSSSGNGGGSTSGTGNGTSGTQKKQSAKSPLTVAHETTETLTPERAAAVSSAGQTMKENAKADAKNVVQEAKAVSALSKSPGTVTTMGYTNSVNSKTQAQLQLESRLNKQVSLGDVANVVKTVSSTTAKTVNSVLEKIVKTAKK